jgi:chloramphenicol 3-O phosphotransferase
MSVIMLNGTSCAGKSTLAATLQDMLTDAGECWLVMSQDDFFSKIPRAFLRYGTMHVGSFADQGVSLAIVDGTLTRRAGEVGQRLLDAYRAAIAATARDGVNVIVDEVLVDESDWRSWLRHLDGLDVHWVAVRAPLEVVERRERDRADRVDGTAPAEYDQVHRFASYRTEVDTGLMDPSAAARAIVAAR